MKPIFTTYYGKRYRAVVHTTPDKVRGLAHAIGRLLTDDMDVKEKHFMLIEHHGKKSLIFVKEPFDSIIKSR
jgi:hypothetical protein